MTYVRAITIQDPDRDPDELPIHVGTRVLFDGEPPQCTLSGGVSVESEPNDGTRVTLYVLAKDVHVEPLPRPAHAEGEWDCYSVRLGPHEVLTPKDGLDWDALDEAVAWDVVPVTFFAREVHFA